MEDELLIIGPSIQERGIGGVTVHVQRLKDYLDLHDISYRFLDYKSNGILRLFKAITKAQIIHFHISNPLFLFVLVIYACLRRKKTVITLHEDYGRHGLFKNVIVSCIIRMVTTPIVLNEHSYKMCKEINNRTLLIPAFIPPQKEEILQEAIISLLEKIRKENRKIVSTNAFNILIDKDGNDVYGIDFLVNYFRDSETKVLVVSDPSGNYHNKYSNIITNSVFFIDYPHSYYEVLKRADYFVRNTSTDGDALSVKEALFLGLPAICSDVVDRPKGVLLFKYSDKVSFESCFDKINRGNHNIENGAEKIIQLYRTL